MNERPFSHVCGYGVTVTADRCDFRGGVTLEGVPTNEQRDDAIANAVATAIGFHAVNIWPKLNGFQGYDCLEFTIVDAD